MMGQIEIVYQDRILKITKCLTEKGKNKYKIEITDGRFCRNWEEYFTNDEQARESAQQKFRKFCNKRKRRDFKMGNESKQEIESAVSEAMTKFLKEQMGEQAEAVITQVVGDTIIVRFKGVLPPAERHLAKAQEGVKLMKELKLKLIERARPLLEVMIRNLTDAEVIDVHSSFNVETGERVEVFTLDKDLEKTCQA
jgi:uncharacterized protein YbcI